MTGTAADVPAPAKAGSLFAGRERAIAYAALAFVGVLQAILLTHKGINWDEFFHLTEIYRFRDGTLTHPLQTFWVRLLAWVPATGGTSVDQIIVVRVFMLLAALVTAGGVFAVARRFAEPAAALLCALAFLSAGYVFTQAFAYRADPLV